MPRYRYGPGVPVGIRLSAGAREARSPEMRNWYHPGRGDACLSSGNYCGIRLRGDRKRLGSATDQPRADPATEQCPPVTCAGTARRAAPRKRSARTMGTKARQFAFCLGDGSACSVGTNDEGCPELSFIAGANRSWQQTESKRHRVNRRVCGVGEDDLRGEGQG